MSNKKPSSKVGYQLAILVISSVLFADLAFTYNIFDGTSTPTAVLSAPAQVLYGQSFTLDGSGSYAVAPARIDRYTWTYLGPASSASIGGGFSTSATFVLNMPIETSSSSIEVTIAPGNELPVGSHRFRLVVRDDMGVESAPDIKEVYVRDPNAPTAVLSAPAQVLYGQSFTLDGSASYAVAPARVDRYTWTYLGPVSSASSGGGFSTSATFVLNMPIETSAPSIEVTVTSGNELPVGSHRFRLVAGDDMGRSSPPDIREVLVINTTTTVPVTTTTSEPPATTTTTTIIPSTTTTIRRLCPFILLAGDAQETLRLLYGFRNEILFNSPQGRHYITLFYQHAEEVASILIKNPAIAAQSRSVLNMLMPFVKSVLEGKKTDLTQDMSTAVEDILDEIAAEASPELKIAIETLTMELRQGTILKGK